MEILKGQQLLKKTGVVVDADEALQGKKIICFYFSALWCPPCKAFTPVLTEFYQVIKMTLIYQFNTNSPIENVLMFQELVKEEEPIEVIFVSGDNSPDELLANMKAFHGDWLAVQHGARLIEYDYNLDVTRIQLEISNRIK